MTTKESLTAQLLREKNIIGKILEDSAQYKKIPFCTPEHFTDSNYRYLFQVIRNLALVRQTDPAYIEKVIVDTPSVMDTLNQEGKTDLFSVVLNITDKTYLTIDITQTFKELEQSYKKRKAYELTKQLQKELDTPKDLQTVLTDFHYRTQSLKNDNDQFSPTEIRLDCEFEEAAELCHFDNELVLRKGNIMLLQAAEGSGKSRTISAIIASNYAPTNSDNLGFRLKNDKQEIILHIDTEQEKTEVLHSMKRIIRRSEGADIVQDNKIKNYVLQSFVTIPSIAEKRTWLFNLIEQHGKNIGVLVLDGMTDFINDINDLTESQNFITRLISYMNVYSFGIIGTIHTNTGSDGSGKARGHIGSELKRKAGSNIAIVKTKLTHEFSEEYGEEMVRRLVCLKNRFSTDDISIHYAWHGKKRMFATCELTGMDQSKKRKLSHSSKVELLIKEVVKSNEQLTHTELCERISTYTEKSKRTARRNIETALKDGHLVKGDNELYCLSSPELFE